jgi:hypothetical protein
MIFGAVQVVLDSVPRALLVKAAAGPSLETQAAEAPALAGPAVLEALPAPAVPATGRDSFPAQAALAGPAVLEALPVPAPLVQAVPAAAAPVHRPRVPCQRAKAR